LLQEPALRERQHSEQFQVHYERMCYSRLAQQCSCAVSILASHQSAIVDQTPRFNNSEFNSSQSFLNLVITMDPNIKWDLSNTLPQWSQWIEEDPAEMLFNRTAMDVPILELKKTSERLQNRCE